MTEAKKQENVMAKAGGELDSILRDFDAFTSVRDKHLTGFERESQTLAQMDAHIEDSVSEVADNMNKFESEKNVAKQNEENVAKQKTRTKSHKREGTVSKQHAKHGQRKTAKEAKVEKQRQGVQKQHAKGQNTAKAGTQKKKRNRNKGQKKNVQKF